MTNKQLLAFEESEQCKGCEHCLSGKYIHSFGYKWAIKKIAGKEEARIIVGGIISGLVLVGVICILAQVIFG